VGLTRSAVNKIVGGVKNSHEPTINATPPTEEIVKLQEENNKTKIELASLREELVQAKQRAAALAGREPVQANPQKKPFKAPIFTQKVLDYLFRKVWAFLGVLMAISAKCGVLDRSVITLSPKMPSMVTLGLMNRRLSQPVVNRATREKRRCHSRPTIPAPPRRS
jgi:cell division septum initiation protein DivIVA